MVIGIDVGGTKTKAVLFDKSGNSLKEVSLPSAHPMNADDETVIRILKGCILEENCPVVIGYAGYGKSPAMRKKIEDLVHTAMEGMNVTILSDIETALYSTLEDRNGMTVILGTGSIALYRNGDTIERRGGWGYVLGDEGSGYDIGRSLLRYAVKQADHRAEKNRVLDLVLEHFHLDDPAGLISTVVHDGAVDRTAIASCARISAECADIPEVNAILETAAEEVKAMLDSFGYEPCETVITGGMSKNSVYMEKLRERISYMKTAENEPVYGCYTYAKLKNII